MGQFCLTEQYLTAQFDLYGCGRASFPLQRHTPKTLGVGRSHSVAQKYRIRCRSFSVPKKFCSFCRAWNISNMPRDTVEIVVLLGPVPDRPERAPDRHIEPLE